MRKRRNRRRGQKQAGPIWTSVGSFGTYDAFRSQKEPSKLELIKAYEDAVYACVNLLASTVASVPIRLYVQTRPGEARPKCGTRAITAKNWERCQRTPGLSALTRKAMDIQEVTDHPLLDLLYSVNDRHNFHDLMELTDTYQELVGSAYWYTVKDVVGIPVEIYILPSQYVCAELSEDGWSIKNYKVRVGQRESVYDPADVVQFDFHNPAWPYGEGYSPTRAAYERVRLGKLELAYFAATLSNQARPDAVLAPTSPDQPLGSAEAERLAKDFTTRFRQGGVGGVLVLPEAMQLTPLAFPPKDIGSVDLFKDFRLQIQNCFGVPPSWFDAGQSNRSIAESEEYKLARNAIWTRIRRRDEKLNEKLVPMFGEPRLFLMSDDPVPENADRELSRQQFLASVGAITRDELRIESGYESQEWAAEPLLPAGMFPADSAPITGLPGQPTDQPPDVQAEAAPDPAQVQALQLAVYSGQLPREAAIAQLVFLHQVDRQTAEALFPEVQPPAAAPAPPPTKAKAFQQQKATALFVRTLQRFFGYQREEVLRGLKSLDLATVKAVSVLDEADYGAEHWTWKARPDYPVIDLSHWTNQMFAELQPIVRLFADHAVAQTVDRLGLAGDFVPVVQPRIDEAVKAATLQFCAATNDTTSLVLSDALAKLRDELGEGVTAGDTYREITARVQSVFERAELERAHLIAVTESARAASSAQLITAKESGIVKGKRWLLSSMPCPACVEVAQTAAEVGLDEPFFTDAKGYSDGQGPPVHPACQCGWQEVLDEG